MHAGHPEADVDGGARLARPASSPRIVEAPARSIGQARAGGVLRRAPAHVRAARWTGAGGPVRAAGARRDRAIPYGGHLSYAEVAAEAGTPRGARAAGNASAPTRSRSWCPATACCAPGAHLGGYGGGLDRKRYLLELEGVIQAAQHGLTWTGPELTWARVSRPPGLPQHPVGPVPKCEGSVAGYPPALARSHRGAHAARRLASSRSTMMRTSSNPGHSRARSSTSACE